MPKYLIHIVAKHRKSLQILKFYFSKGDVKPCPGSRSLGTKHFTTWYGNFQSNDYKLKNNITANTVQQLYYKVLNKLAVTLINNQIIYTKIEITC